MIEILNTFDPQVSSKLARMLEGPLCLEGMDRTTRVNRITALIELYKAIMTIGELEHTSDWDWRIEVVWGDARNVAGTYDISDDEFSWCDTISLDYETEPGDYVAGFERWHYLAVEEFHGDETHEVLIPIDEIHTITIGQA